MKNSLMKVVRNEFRSGQAWYFMKLHAQDFWRTLSPPCTSPALLYIRIPPFLERSNQDILEKLAIARSKLIASLSGNFSFLAQSSPGRLRTYSSQTLNHAKRFEKRHGQVYIPHQVSCSRLIQSLAVHVHTRTSKPLISLASFTSITPSLCPVKLLMEIRVRSLRQ